MEKINIDFPKLKSTKLYTLIKSMPKGVLLHAHFGALGNLVKFLIYLNQKHPQIFKNIYFVDGINGKDKILKYNDDMQKRMQKEWRNYKDFCVPFNLSSNFEYGLTYFPDEPPCDGYKSFTSYDKGSMINNIVSIASRMQNKGEYTWNHLELYTNKTWSLIKNSEIFELYTRFILDETRGDGLLGVELKTNIGGYHTKKSIKCKCEQVPSLSNIIYTGEFIKTIERDILRKLKLEYIKLFNFNFNLVYGIHRGNPASIDYVKKSINDNCSYLEKRENINLINSIDLFGEEDKGNTNDKFHEELTKCNAHLAIHSGETNTKVEYNPNLKYIADLSDSDKQSKKNRKIRVGHALRLCMNEQNNVCEHGLLDKYADNQIHIELCPISNYILDYVENNDFKKHPANYYINTYNRLRMINGKPELRLSINSDDPSIYNYDYVTYDWLIAIAFWDLKIEDIKKMCIWSIEDSTFTKEEKTEYLKRFEGEFKLWLELNHVNSILTEYKQKFLDKWRSISSTDIDASASADTSGSAAKHKYLKYKLKYLNLKKLLK